MWKDGLSGNKAVLQFSIRRWLKSLAVTRSQYESDPIFDVLLHIAARYNFRLLPYFASIEPKLALAFLESEASGTTSSAALEGSKGISVMETLGTQFIQRTYRQPYRSATAEQVAAKSKTSDGTPFDESVGSYNEFVWALAQKFTNSREEAQAAVQEMQTDIQRCAERGVFIPSNEDHLVALISWRRLLRFLQ